MHEWEEVSNRHTAKVKVAHVYRMPVPGGWLYHVEARSDVMTTVFVPDPNGLPSK